MRPSILTDHTSARVATADPLTSADYWDEQWSGVSLPSLASRATQWGPEAAILDALDALVPLLPGKRVLEIGGAPGGHLAYLAKSHGVEPHMVDSSPVGCSMARRNFDLLGLSATINEGDLFRAPGDPASYDLVYSLGLLEHFVDFRSVIARHAELATPGGYIFIEVPWFVHVFRRFIGSWSPATLAAHNLSALDMNNWDAVVRDLGLASIAKVYAGGFEPNVAVSLCPDPNVPPSAAFLAACVRRLTWIRYHLYRVAPACARLQTLDSRWWSSVAYCVLRKPLGHS